MKKKASLVILSFVLAIAASGCSTPPSENPVRNHQAGQISGFAWTESTLRFHPGTTLADVYVITHQPPASSAIEGLCTVPSGTLTVAFEDTAAGDYLLVETATYSDTPNDYCLVAKNDVRPATLGELENFVVTDYAVEVAYPLPQTIDNSPKLEQVAGYALFPAVVGSYFVGWGQAKPTTKGAELTFDSLRAAEAARSVDAIAIRAAFQHGTWANLANSIGDIAGMGFLELEDFKKIATAEEALRRVEKLQLAKRLASAAESTDLRLVIGDRSFMLVPPKVEQGGEMSFAFARGPYTTHSGVWPFRVSQDIPGISISYSIRRPDPRVMETLQSIKNDTRLLPGNRQTLRQAARDSREGVRLANQGLEQSRANAAAIVETGKQLVRLQATIEQSKGAILEQMAKFGMKLEHRQELLEKMMVDTERLGTNQAEIAENVKRILQRDPTVNVSVGVTQKVDVIEEVSQNIATNLEQIKIANENSGVARIARPAIKTGISQGAANLTPASSRIMSVPAPKLMREPVPAAFGRNDPARVNPPFTFSPN